MPIRYLPPYTATRLLCVSPQNVICTGARASPNAALTSNGTSTPPSLITAVNVYFIALLVSLCTQSTRGDGQSWRRLPGLAIVLATANPLVSRVRGPASSMHEGESGPPNAKHLDHPISPARRRHRRARCSRGRRQRRVQRQGVGPRGVRAAVRAEQVRQAAGHVPRPVR